MQISDYMYLGGLFIATVVWAVRLEGRINTESQKLLDLKEFLKTLIDSKFDATDQRLERIERGMNGTLRND